MTTHHTTRRAPLAGVAVVATLSAISDDPVFAAIKKHRRLHAQHAAALSAANRDRAARKATGLTRLQKRERAACEAVCKASRALIATQPATIAGTLALVAYATECRDDLLVDGDESYYTLLDSVTWALGSQVPGEIARSIEAAAA